MITNPSPRDWVDDFAHENGNYQCRCTVCKHPFVGYKRRVICKECHDRDAEESKRRAEWLTAHGAPLDWVVLTLAEVTAIQTESMAQFHRSIVEGNRRRELTKVVDDLLFQMDCAATIGAGFSGKHPMLKDVRAALEKCKELDSPAKEESQSP